MPSVTPLREMLNLQISGLYLNPSTFDKIPAGALRQADDVVIDRENIVSYRRGFDFYGSHVADAGINGLFPYANNKLRHTTAGVMQYDANGLGNWTSYSGTYVAPDVGVAGSRVRSVESNKNFYFLTSAGTYKLDALTATPRPAGAPQGLSGTGVTTGITGFMANLTNVAYRVVWGYRDANNNLILGAPSERIIVSNNSGTTANVTLTIQIPAEITPAWFLQVYRSSGSVNLATQPNDELQQTIEQSPTTAECTARIITLVDTTPDSLLQGFIYTAQSQQGILQSNYRPPFARDVCFFKSCTFYANTRTVQTLNESLVSVESPNGFQIGDTITFTDNTIGGGGTFTMIGAAAENAGTGAFKISNTGDPAIDIQNTAQSLCKIANVYASNLFLNAYYVSDFNDIPGQINFQKRNLTPESFYVNCSRGTAFTPPIPALPVSGTDQTVSSTGDVSPNRVYFSKILQPEAVPLLNYIQVGSLNQPVERIIPLRDGIIVLKQDGVFRIFGDTPETFTSSLLDNTTRILAPNSADVLDNKVFFLSDQGIVAASDNSVEIMSRPIERTLLALTSPNLYPNTKDLAFGVSYNADRKYIISFPTSGTDTYCKQQFCYNTITATWTRWTRPALCALVFIGDDKLHWGGPNDATYGGNVFQERKSYTDSDFADEHYDRTISAHTSDTVTLTNVTSVVIGSQVIQVATASSARVTAINGSVLTLDTADLDWTNTSCVVYTPITGVIQTVQIDAGNAGAYKQYSEASFVYSESNFDSMDAYFSSDQSGSEYKVVLTPQQRGGWGTFNWGSLPWGGDVAGGQQRIRKQIPAKVQRANWIFVRLQLKQCFVSFGLSGMGFAVNSMSTRQK